MNPTDESPLLLLFRENRLAISLFMISLLLLGGGLIDYLFVYHPFTRDEITFESVSPTIPQASRSPQSQEINYVIDISGAVKNPGVYTLAADSRIQDVILKAGGLSEDADTSLVAKQLNLAAKIHDGQKIYIPVVGDTAVLSSMSEGTQESGRLVNINSASLQELDSLPGVGEISAQKIISNRPYSVINELQTKKVLGKKVFNDIKDMITVD